MRDDFAAATRPKKVLIVDDTRTIRAMLRATIAEDPRLEVVGEAADPLEARELIKLLSPDVITLDVEMPRMDGLEFLEKLMRLRPMPVVMVSSRTKARSEIAVRALSMGAVECVDVALLQGDPVRRSQLADTLLMAASAHVSARVDAAPVMARTQPAYRWNGRIVVIGSSTGGVDALERVLAPFPADGPPVVIAQHMPDTFLQSFARRLNQSVEPEVRIAREGDRLEVGTVLLGPGGQHHVAFARRGEPRLRLPLATGQELYVPEVDILFKSAEPFAPDILAVLLTGMGRDGADGMSLLRQGGARTLAQSGPTCVVDGMPRSAREAGAVQRSVGLEDLGAAILAECSGRRGRPDE